MSKIISFGDEAKNKILLGVSKVADAVKITMGPKGRNVVIQQQWANPIVTNDGVTVAKAVELKDDLENMGASFVIEAASKTNDEAGDGTTSTVVLTEAIVKEGLKYIRQWYNPFSIVESIHSVVAKILSIVWEMAKTITTKDEIKNIATISAQDEAVWELIADVMDQIGNDGVITVEEWKTSGLEKTIVQWLQVDSGYISPYFINNERGECELNDCAILITDFRIQKLKDIIHIMEALQKRNVKSLLIIADDAEHEWLASLILNHVKKVMNICCIKAPAVWTHRKNILGDIAVVTGGSVITEELWLTLAVANDSHLWFAKKVIVKKDSTIIVDATGDTKAIEEKLKVLIWQRDNTTSDFDRETLQKRIAKIIWWVAVIKVWAATEMEMKNKKYKIEDALAATRSAIDEWVVAWGGTAFLKAYSLLIWYDFKWDDKIAFEIIWNAIQYPCKQIIKNAGWNGEYIAEVIKNEKSETVWYNAKTGDYGDLIKEWVIDPAKVLRCSLQNAASAASMILTSDAFITFEKEECQK